MWRRCPVPCEVSGRRAGNQAEVVVQRTIGPKPVDVVYLLGNKHREECADLGNGHQPLYPLPPPSEPLDPGVAGTDTVLYEGERGFKSSSRSLRSVFGSSGSARRTFPIRVKTPVRQRWRVVSGCLWIKA